MTLATTTSRIVYVGNGSTTVFSFPYYFFADGDLTVTLEDTSGVYTVQTITTHYTVQDAGEQAGGSVTMVTAPVLNYNLIIEREVDLTQATDYVANDNFPSSAHENVVDKNVMMSQQLRSVLDRCLKFPKAEYATSDYELASNDDREEKYIWFDATGALTLVSSLLGTAVVVTDTTITLSTTSLWIQFVVDTTARTVKIYFGESSGDNSLWTTASY